MRTSSKGPVVEWLESRTLLSTAVPGTPDVVVTVPATFTKSYIAGESTKGLKIPVNLANDGTAAATGNVDIVLFASLTQTVDLDSAQITPKAVVKGTGIAAGHNKTYEIPISAFPQNLDGSYFITANANGKSVNASGVSSNTVTIAPANVQFTASIPKVPRTGHLGSSIAVTLDVQNVGNFEAKGTLVIDVSESPNADGSNAGGLETFTQKGLALNPGKTHVFHLNVKLPIGSASGNQYIVATVDPANTFNSPVLTSNTAVSLTPVSIS